jgi:transposase InsO family protein
LIFREDGPNKSLAVYEPFQRLAMDFVGPLPADSKGCVFILVIVDAFTRWVELFPVEAASADVVAQSLQQVYGRYGLPEEILSDNGSHFTANVIKALMDYLDVAHIFSTPYHHPGNGQVERFNREVMRHLRAIVFDELLYEHWSMILPRVQYVLNTTVNATTGASPMQLLFGSAITVNRALPGIDFASPIESTTHEYIQQLQKLQARILEVARQQQAKAEQSRLANQPDHLEEFFPQELVLVRYPDGPPSKLHPTMKGPYKVIAKASRSYTLEDILTGKQMRADISRLRRYVVNDTNLEELERIVARDYREYEVEGILEHRRTNNGFEFLVKWKGFANSANTWEPMKHLRNNTLFLDYAKRHKIKVKLA